MTTFDRREEAFEAKFAHDEEMHFRAEARRAKVLAHWVAEQNGREDADGYAHDLVDFVVTHPGDAALFDRLKADLNGKIADAQLHDRLSVAMADALHFVKSA